MQTLHPETEIYTWSFALCNNVLQSVQPIAYININNLRKHIMKCTMEDIGAQFQFSVSLLAVLSQKFVRLSEQQLHRAVELSRVLHIYTFVPSYHSICH